VTVYLFAALMQATGVPATLNYFPLLWDTISTSDPFEVNLWVMGISFLFSLLAIPIAWVLRKPKLQYVVFLVVTVAGLVLAAVPAYIEGQHYYNSNRLGLPRTNRNGVRCFLRSASI
jgi:peptidoglycan/LPS O-acetylase OafA/YrhL